MHKQEDYAVVGNEAPWNNVYIENVLKVYNTHAFVHVSTNFFITCISDWSRESWVISIMRTSTNNRSNVKDDVKHDTELHVPIDSSVRQVPMYVQITPSTFYH